jgi:hypothetical protein
MIINIFIKLWSSPFGEFAAIENFIIHLSFMTDTIAMDLVRYVGKKVSPYGLLLHVQMAIWTTYHGIFSYMGKAIKSAKAGFIGLVEEVP